MVQEHLAGQPRPDRLSAGLLGLAKGALVTVCGGVLCCFGDLLCPL
ncbi:hypothetical protein RR11_1512 [Ruegeria sp. R11]|nr:hypothetical protein RR11_1512 [Ruegeria sp. R11]